MLYTDEPEVQLGDSLAVLRRDIPWCAAACRRRSRARRCPELSSLPPAAGAPATLLLNLPAAPRPCLLLLTRPRSSPAPSLACRDIYQTARLITDRDLQLLRRYDKKEPAYQARLLEEVGAARPHREAATLLGGSGHRGRLLGGGTGGAGRVGWLCRAVLPPLRACCRSAARPNGPLPCPLPLHCRSLGPRTSRPS